MTHDLNVGAETLMYNGNYRGNVNIEDWVVQSEVTCNTLAEQRTIISGGRVIKDFQKEFPLSHIGRQWFTKSADWSSETTIGQWFSANTLWR